MLTSRNAMSGSESSGNTTGWVSLVVAVVQPHTAWPRPDLGRPTTTKVLDIFCAAWGRTQNLRILGPSLWLFMDSVDYLRVPRLQTLVVCGYFGLSGCVL